MYARRQPASSLPAQEFPPCQRTGHLAVPHRRAEPGACKEVPGISLNLSQQGVNRTCSDSSGFLSSAMRVMSTRCGRGDSTTCSSQRFPVFFYNDRSHEYVHSSGATRMSAGIVDGSDSEERPETFEDWGDDETAMTKCLFTDRIFDSVPDCLSHARDAYGLDVMQACRRHQNLPMCSPVAAHCS